ncbi:hypothetical protein RvY_16752 [Ramazzottius varieornatus]|uniref:Uncharacterized protein n=1 Tax=Ramazzottius varieornatus TaxID=947166 RepID=A0A1D1W0A3_RAMVA|nr:hypothetical protein RvY_16752 [Ramazzottius varieornatus]
MTSSHGPTFCLTTHRDLKALRPDKATVTRVLPPIPSRLPLLVAQCVHATDAATPTILCPLARDGCYPGLPYQQPFVPRYPYPDRGYGYQTPPFCVAAGSSDQATGYGFPQAPFGWSNPQKPFSVSYDTKKQSKRVSPIAEVCQPYNLGYCEGPGCLDGRLHLCNVCFSREHSVDNTGVNPHPGQ